MPALLPILNKPNTNASDATSVEFLFIGVQKAGSTWLHRNLTLHPEIFLAEGAQDKDVQYFSCFYDRGYEWYKRFFSGGIDHKIRGEISTSYFPCADAPSRVAAFNPDMRLVLCLRNPVDRLISNHEHEVRLGHVSERNYALNSGIANNPAYVDQSMYAHHLANWLEHFSLDSFHIMIFEEMFADPLVHIQELCAFLGVDRDFIPESIDQRMNVSRVSRNKSMGKVASNLSSLMRRSGLGRIVDSAKSMGAKAIVERPNSDDTEPVKPATDQRLRLRAIFEDDIQRLSKMLSRDLSVWDH